MVMFGDATLLLTGMAGAGGSCSPGGATGVRVAEATGLPSRTGFRHEALLYAGVAEFAARVADFVRDGIVEGERSVVVVAAHKVGLLRAVLSGVGGAVEFFDMAEVGRNPARLTGLFADFVDRHAGSGMRLRAVGEPIWPGRRKVEVAECHRHEQLLNLAFEGCSGFWLVCPYDVEALDPTVVAGACRTHPHVAQGGTAATASDTYQPWCDGDWVLGEPLADPPDGVAELNFAGVPLALVRAYVEGWGSSVGLDVGQVDSLVLAVSELAANSHLYGGDRCHLRAWVDETVAVCELSDGGRLSDPLTGRRRAAGEAESGRGLWLANHLCDLTQLRSSAEGTVVRLHYLLQAPRL